MTIGGVTLHGVTNEKIRIAYDGEALRSGAMDVRALAPALLALSDLFDESNKLLNGKDSAVQLRVQADFKAGSFEITVQVAHAWLTELLAMFASSQASAIANLLGILGFGGTTGVTLLQLLKRLKGKPVKRVEILNENDARVIVEGDEIIISRKLATVFSDVRVRKALAAVLEPLSRPGVDRFEVRSPDGSVATEVTSDERALFDVPPPVEIAPESIVTNEFKQAFTIVTVAFKDGNKWRVSDGQSTINVSIEDNAFLARVDSHEESFAKDDTVLCMVRQEQTLRSSGLQTEWAITKVIEHRPAQRQLVMQITLPEISGEPEDKSG